MSLNQKFTQIEHDLSQIFFERSELVRGSVLAVLIGQHVCFIGPPGTAKSMLTRELCSRIEGATYFDWLMTKFSTPEEIFGPVSLKALENDSYRRITTDKLPEAHIAFLDEVWNANSAIQNSLLSIVNERIYHNDGQPVQCPLISLFGASNLFPQGEELGAIYDRFLLRYQVDYLVEDVNFTNLLNFQNSSGGATVTLDELQKAQEEVRAVDVPADVIEQLVELRRLLKKEGLLASDRRWRQCIGLLKAGAWMDGRSAVDEEDIGILIHALWSDPEHFRTVQKVVNSVANPLNQKALEFLDMATELHQKAVSGDSDAGLEANRGLKNIAKEIEALIQANPKSKATKLKETLTKVMAFNKEVVTKCLGIDL